MADLKKPKSYLSFKLVHETFASDVSKVPEIEEEDIMPSPGIGIT